jgi:hypothetical protein
MCKEIIHWGVACRKCSEPIAFGAPSHQQFQLESTFARPGAIRCANGHTHIYFPRDFKFFASSEAIPEAVMHANREAHRAINPPPATQSDQMYGTRWVPVEEPQAASLAGLVGVSLEGKASSSAYGLDPRREKAQAAARERWTSWAIKKVQ